MWRSDKRRDWIIGELPARLVGSRWVLLAKVSSGFALIAGLTDDDGSHSVKGSNKCEMARSDQSEVGSGSNLG